MKIDLNGRVLAKDNKRVMIYTYFDSEYATEKLYMCEPSSRNEYAILHNCNVLYNGNYPLVLNGSRYYVIHKNNVYILQGAYKDKAKCIINIVFYVTSKGKIEVHPCKGTPSSQEVIDICAKYQY